MGKLLAAAATVLVISFAPTVSLAAPSQGAKPLETASAGLLQDVRHYRRHHRYYRHYHWRHHRHYYWRHHRHHRHWRW